MIDIPIGIMKKVEQNVTREESGKKMTGIHVRIDEEMKAALEAVSSRKGYTVSQLTRALLDAYLFFDMRIESEKGKPE